MREDNPSTNAKMSELTDKDFKAVVIKMLQQAITNSLQTLEKIENLGKEQKL